MKFEIIVEQAREEIWRRTEKKAEWLPKDQ